MKEKRLFFDTEFTELSVKGELISLAFLSDNDQVFYAEFNDYSLENCSGWVKENVIPKLLFNDRETHFDKQQKSSYIKDKSGKIAHLLAEWFSEIGPVEIYSDCHAFDWVFFCNLYGTAFDLPKEIFYIPLDLATLFKYRGIKSDTNRESFVSTYKGHEFIEEIKIKANGAHNSLFDAFLIRASFEILECNKQNFHYQS